MSHFNSSHKGGTHAASSHYGLLAIVAIPTGGGDDFRYKPSILAEQIRREDEEIIMIVMSFMGMMK